MRILLAAISFFWLCFWLCVSVAHSQQVVLVTSDGQEIAGKLVSISDEGVEFVVDGEDRQLPVDQVFAIRRRGATVAVDLAFNQVGLVDGSILAAEQLTANDQEVTLVAPSSEAIVVPRRDVAWLQQIRYEDQATNSRWQEILQSTDRAGDLLVFRRNGQLDYLEGLIGNIDGDSIEFRSNGQVNQAPRDRIDAVVYFQGIERAFGQPVGKLTTVSGEVISVRSGVMNDGQFALETVCGVALQLPVEQLVTIELGNRRVVYLSKLDPSTSDWQPLVLNREIADYQKVLNRARFDRTFDGKMLQLRFPRKENTGAPAQLVEFSHGIAAKGGTRLVFDLAGEFSTLTGIAGFAPGYSDEGHVEIIVTGDGRELLRQAMEKRVGGPVPMEMNVTNVRRLVIRIEYLDGRNIGDVVHLCDLKVVR